VKSNIPPGKVRASAKTIFVTGTDTGVGKTLLTALVLHHLRRTGCHALAMKPFCSGGRGDVKLLNSLQNCELLTEEINPFYFVEPIAPLIAARMHGRNVSLNEVLDRVRKLKSKCDWLVIEGSGGLLVPLGEGYTVLDLMMRLGCPVVVVARNRLGVLNHTLLTIKAMQAVGIKSIAVVLMSCYERDTSAQTNEQTLTELLSPIGVLNIPFLGEGALRPAAIKRNYKKIKKTVALLADFDSFTRVLLNDSQKRLETKSSVDSPRGRK
jgi:dethiobiotin synthase